jgi:Zn-dependent protease with chaperone function
MPPVVLHEAAIKRNRRRIVVLAALAFLNFWVAAIVFVVCVVVGAIVAFIAEGVIEGLDFDLLAALLGVLPEAVAWVFTDAVTSPVTAFVVLGFVVAGSLFALFTLAFRLGRVEGRVLGETGARVDPTGVDPQLRNLVEGLAISAHVAPPRLAIVDDAAPNAFAVGRKAETAVIGVTTGLLDTLSRDETEAVVSYEISRVASRDIALCTWAVAMTGHTIETWENSQRISVKLGLLLPVFLAHRLRAFVLRGQTAQQDMLAVRFTRNPRALLDALVKLRQDGRVISRVTSASAPLWLEPPVPGASRLDSRITALSDLLRDRQPDGTLAQDRAAETAGE